MNDSPKVNHLHRALPTNNANYKAENSTKCALPIENNDNRIVSDCYLFTSTRTMQPARCSLMDVIAQVVAGGRSESVNAQWNVNRVKGSYEKRSIRNDMQEGLGTCNIHRKHDVAGKQLSMDSLPRFATRILMRNLTLLSIEGDCRNVRNTSLQYACQ